MRVWIWIIEVLYRFKMWIDALRMDDSIQTTEYVFRAPYTMVCNPGTVPLTRDYNYEPSSTEY
jgi:hypothetical protein